MSECSVWACSKLLTCMYLFDPPTFQVRKPKWSDLPKVPKLVSYRESIWTQGVWTESTESLLPHWLPVLSAAYPRICYTRIKSKLWQSFPPFSLVSGVPDKSSVCAKSRCFWSLVAFCLLCPAVYSPETEADGRIPWVDSSWNRELQSDFLLQRENEDLQDVGLEGTGRAVSSLCCPGVPQCAQLQVGDRSKWLPNQ